MESQHKVKLTAVSYHNTKPFLYGLENGPLAQELDISLDIPAVGAGKLQSGELSLGLIPVGALHNIADAKIISDFCIGAEGAVKTVCLYAEKPIEELNWVYLDYHSRTSVRLLQILFQHHWKLYPIYLKAEPGYREKISGKTGGLIIGDRAMSMEKRFPYVYDLGEEWQKMTGLPFVFAAWVATTEFPSKFLDAFNSSLEMGVKNIPKVVEQYKGGVPLGFDLETYLSSYISFELDQKKMEALRLFMELMGHQEPAFQNNLEPNI